MSMEMHVFLAKSRVPDRSAWQNAIDSLKLPLELYPALDTINDSGFSPSKIMGEESGFEIYSGPAEDVLASYPELAKVVDKRDWCLSFGWGGDLKECACALAASAALVESCDAIAYSPEGDIVYDLPRLLDEANLCLRLQVDSI